MSLSIHVYLVHFDDKHGGSLVGDVFFASNTSNQARAFLAHMGLQEQDAAEGGDLGRTLFGQRWVERALSARDEEDFDGLIYAPLRCRSWVGWLGKHEKRGIGIMVVET